MKRSLRVTLLTILISLTVLSIGLVGINGFLQSQEATRELTQQIVKQATRRVDTEIDDLLHSAERQTKLNQHLFATGLLDVVYLQFTAEYWLEVLKTHPSISALYITLEADGTSLLVTRYPGRNNKLLIQELRPDAVKGTMDLYNYEPEEYASRLHPGEGVLGPLVVGLAASHAGPLPAAFTLEASKLPRPVRSDPNLDQRGWEWYRRAKAANQPGWTHTYLFFNEAGQLSYPGLTYSAPVRRADGTLLGAVAIDFNVYTLCDYLKELHVTENGFAFVVEQRRDDGKRKLIAHPDEKVVLAETATNGRERRKELVDIDKVSDPRVAAFMARVPTDIDPDTLRGDTAVAFSADGDGFLGGFGGLEETGASPPWIICIVIPEDDVLSHIRKHARIAVLIAGIVFVIAIILSIITAGQVARPLERLAEEVSAIAKLEISPRQVGRSFIREVDRLETAVEDMKAGLRSFKKYVPADLVRRLLESGKEAVLGGERRQLTIYFSDIANFTTISESLSPEQLVDHLGEYLEVLSAQILATGGTVDKYIGDAIMAFWGAPADHADHAVAACTAALRNQQALIKLREQWRADGKPEFEARIGIHTGEVIAGNIGSASRMNYTVIGDAVNLASRLEGLNKYYGSSVLISEDTYEAAKAGIVARPLDWVSVKGRAKAVLVYELLALRSEAAPGLEAFAARCAEALALYRRQDWSTAVAAFEQLLVARPGDAPLVEMLRRCRQYQVQPPGAEWDGVHHMVEK